MRFFILVLGLEILYMLIRLETTSLSPFGDSGGSVVWTLKQNPITFLIFLVSFSVAEIFLVILYMKMRADEKRPKRRKMKKKNG